MAWGLTAGLSYSLYYLVGKHVFTAAGSVLCFKANPYSGV